MDARVKVKLGMTLEKDAEIVNSITNAKCDKAIMDARLNGGIIEEHFDYRIGVVTVGSDKGKDKG